MGAFVSFNVGFQQGSRALFCIRKVLQRAIIGIFMRLNMDVDLVCKLPASINAYSNRSVVFETVTIRPRQSLE